MSSLADHKPASNAENPCSHFSAQDREDIREIATLLCRHDKAGDCEEFDAAVRAFIEIVYDSLPKLTSYPLSAPPRSLQRWKDFIAGRIKTERKARKMTQAKLAALCDIPQSHLSRIETARLCPSHVTLSKIALALEIPLSKLDSSAPVDE